MSEADAPSRLTKLRHWAAENHGVAPEAVDLQLAADDASFRRYFRLTLGDGTRRILMDAPPAKENLQPFIDIARQWADVDLPVPNIHALNLEAGFLELDDLGDTPLQHCFEGSTSSRTLGWHEQALSLLETLQQRAPTDGLPRYDEALLGLELDLFPTWCLDQWLHIAPPDCWSEVRQQLIESALTQPVVTVHRDYDAMNLMVTEQGLALIDFQDAVAGPLSYDLISLLHGRYCRFPVEQRQAWTEAFRQRAIANGRLSDIDADEFQQWVNSMAVQRCMKVLGIFVRLTLRDHREGYLARLPHFLNHLEDALAPLSTAGMADFKIWVNDTLRPALLTRLQAEDSHREPTA